MKTPFNLKPLTLAVMMALSEQAAAINITASTPLGISQTETVNIVDENPDDGNPLTVQVNSSTSIKPTTGVGFSITNSVTDTVLNFDANTEVSTASGYQTISINTAKNVEINNQGTLKMNGGAAVIFSQGSGALKIVHGGGTIAAKEDYSNVSVVSSSTGELDYTLTGGAEHYGSIYGSVGPTDVVRLEDGTFSGERIRDVETVYLGKLNDKLNLYRAMTVQGSIGNVYLVEGSTLELEAADGVYGQSDYIDSGRIEVQNGNFISNSVTSEKTSIHFIVSDAENNLSDARIKVTGFGRKIELGDKTEIGISPSSAAIQNGLLNKDIILFKAESGATIEGWLADANDPAQSTNWKLSPLFTGAGINYLLIAYNDTDRQVGVRLHTGSGPSNPPASGGSALKSLAEKGGANVDDAKALGVAGGVSSEVIAKNGVGVTTAEADFAAIVAKANDEQSAMRLARELQAQGSTANILAARTAQQGAIKNAVGRIQAIRLADNRIGFGDVAFASADLSAATMTDAAVGTPLYTTQGLWIEGVNVSSDQDDTSAQFGFSAKANGMTIGYDRKLNDQLLAGVALTYGKTQADINGSRDNSDIGTLQLSAYGSYEGNTAQGHAWLTDVVLNIGYNEHESERYLDGFSDQAHKANFNSNQLGLRVTSSVDLKRGDWSIAPTLGFNYAKVDLDGYTESSGPAALKVAGQSVEQLELGIGISARRSFEVNAGKLEPYVGVMAWHDVNNEALSSNSRFVVGGDSFSSADSSDSANRYQVNFGASLQVSEQSNLGFGFEHTKSGSFQSNQWNMAYRHEF